MSTPQRDLTRTTLGVLFIGVLIVATLWVLRPFMAPTIWATMIVVSTWPMMRWFQARLWDRRSLAVLVMTLLILMLLVVPLMLAIGTIVRPCRRHRRPGRDASSGFESRRRRRGWPSCRWSASAPRSCGSRPLPPARWACCRKLAPYADDIAKWFVSQAGSVGLVFVQFLLTVVLAALMYSGGETRGAGGAALRPAAGRRARRQRGHSGRAGHPRRGAGRRRHRVGAVRPRRHRPGHCRRALCRAC